VLGAPARVWGELRVPAQLDLIATAREASAKLAYDESSRALAGESKRR
jgi:hypothetical protein